MPTLKVNGTELDIGNNKIALSKKFYSLDNLNNRVLTYSNEINLPPTSKNSLALNQPEAIFFGANKFNVLYPFTLAFGSSTLFKGAAKLQSANGNLALQLLDSSKELIDNLGENINQLDFEQSDFIFSVAEYDNKKVSNTSVWRWAAVAMHENRTASKTILAGGAATDKLKFSRPLFSMQKIREKIEETHRWQFEVSENLDSANNILISANHKEFFVTSYQKTLNTSVIVNNETNVSGLDSSLDFVKTSAGAINFPNPETIRIPSIKTNFRLRGNIESTADLVLKIKGVSKLGNDELEQIFIINEGTNFYDFKTNAFFTDDSYFDIEIILVGDANVTFLDTLLYTIIEESDLGDLKDNKLLDYYVKAYDNLPDFSQLELVKCCWALNGGFPIVDNFEKKIRIEALKSLGKNSSIDLSAKLDTRKAKIQISQNFGNFGQTNYFEYDNDDTISELTGRGRFSINSEILPKYKTWVKSIFSASNDVIIDSFEMADFNIYSDTERVNTINPRILVLNEVIGAPYALATFKELAGDNILTKNYKKIIESLNNLTIVDCYINLNRLDFFSFKGLRTVYLDFFKSTFLVLEINDYIEGRETSVKLLKLK